MQKIIVNCTESDAMTLHLFREQMIIPVVAIIPQGNGMTEGNRKMTIQLFMIVYLEAYLICVMLYVKKEIVYP